MCGIAGFADATIGSPDAARQRARVQPGAPDVRRDPPSRAGRRGDSRRSTGVGLGMRRLSIIDLAGGHQPIHNEDGTVWVVFNGEIYNFRELRARARSARPPVLHVQRHRDRSSTPTRSGARTPSRGCAACSASRSGTRRRGRCSSRATASASSRCTTRSGGGRLYFGIRDQVAARGRRGRADARSRGARSLPVVPLHAARTLDLRGRPQAAARRTSCAGSDGRVDGRAATGSSPREETFAGSEAGGASRRSTACCATRCASHMVSDVPLGAFLSGGVDSRASSSG